MPIDFHDERNWRTYAARDADESWLACMRENADVSNKVIADIGCGGGIYSKALVKLGARHVTGVDVSEAMVRSAAVACEGFVNVRFVQGNACRTELPADSFDLIMERALIHHLPDLNGCLQEANRLLKDGGEFIVQDRTPEDCRLPGDAHHLRGYFFEAYPRLLEIELARRPDSAAVRRCLELNGFRVTRELQLWETRRMYASFELLWHDLLQRTGRSILHELSDRELDGLIRHIQSRLGDAAAPIVEKDRWTLWFAVKSPGAH